MADDRSVDMDEGRDPTAAPQPRARPTAAASWLSPVQQAYGAWTARWLGCMTCRDVDAGRCAEADGLWRVYEERQQAAYEALTSDT